MAVPWRVLIPGEPSDAIPKGAALLELRRGQGRVFYARGESFASAVRRLPKVGGLWPFPTARSSSVSSTTRTARYGSAATELGLRSSNAGSGIACSETTFSRAGLGEERSQRPVGTYGLHHW